MTPEQLGQFLDQIGNRIGPAGAHVFDIAIRQAVISNLVISVITIIWFIVSIIIGLRFSSLWKKDYATRAATRNKWDEGVPSEEKVLFEGIISISGFIVAAVSLLLLPPYLIGLLNPEYTALMDILSHLPGAK